MKLEQHRSESVTNGEVDKFGNIELSNIAPTYEAWRKRNSFAVNDRIV